MHVRTTQQLKELSNLSIASDSRRRRLYRCSRSQLCTASQQTAAFRVSTCGRSAGATTRSRTRGASAAPYWRPSGWDRWAVAAVAAAGSWVEPTRQTGAVRAALDSPASFHRWLWWSGSEKRTGVWVKTAAHNSTYSQLLCDHTQSCCSTLCVSQRLLIGESVSLSFRKFHWQYLTT